MGLILDLAVAALAATVVVSLALLAWTLAVGVVRAVQRGRRQVASWRHALTDFEPRLHDLAATIDRLASRKPTGEPPDR